ncbi:GNAT superfamily N-acetyltransferase [Nocardioides thalensis]|uniref:GNAT superfamily N-acetyltransferase n=1 Tax=Nocardioides thalensis TaxID=1914755 RepID=A0A853C8G2_9ACTN|nr:GNAT family N-acetyltransferase [Nocardioides thalensis]NYJ02942.1 GNAT superfamily N-acetyltransferase [Nocardioides thalensis]
MEPSERRIRVLQASEIDMVEPLWLALDRQHRSIGPSWATWWEPATTWKIRRERYRQWLAEPDAFALGAFEGDDLVGYLVAHFLPGPDDSWTTGDRIGDVESLAVAPHRRGAGIGSALLTAARERMLELGVRDLWIGVVHGNADALRFYERHGLRPLMVTVASVPGAGGAEGGDPRRG